jgi:hypothetical protein
MVFGAISESLPTSDCLERPVRPLERSGVGWIGLVEPGSAVGWESAFQRVCALSRIFTGAP